MSALMAKDIIGGGSRIAAGITKSTKENPARTFALSFLAAANPLTPFNWVAIIIYIILVTFFLYFFKPNIPYLYKNGNHEKEKIFKWNRLIFVALIFAIILQLTIGTIIYFVVSYTLSRVTSPLFAAIGKAL